MNQVLRQTNLLFFTLVLHGFCSQLVGSERITVTGVIVDKTSGKPIAARLYVENDKGEFFWAEPADANGTVVPYNVDRGTSRESHSAISAHPFKLTLPAGHYKLTVERGKEFLQSSADLEVHAKTQSVRIEMERWIDMNARGWYSGDTHIHRKLEDVPVPLVADDLNVGIPLTYWVTDSLATPTGQNKVLGTPPSPKLIEVEPTRVIWPINTEYEIFSVRGERHTLGAFFVINQKTPLSLPTPPVSPVVLKAREENVLLDLDKHNWPWSMMLPPVAKIDLYELSNNHIWRTNFLFGDWYPEYVGDYMNVEKDSTGKFTEKGWIDFGFENYYTLLNCGFKMKPTAGTATGVHPVPIGFGRVYVYVPEQFDYDQWIEGLKKGNSFVTTGPLLEPKFQGELPGTEFQLSEIPKGRLELTGKIHTVDELDRIEVVVNGEVVSKLEVLQENQIGGHFSGSYAGSVSISESSWIIVRCFTKRAGGRIGFAHTAPVYVTNGNEPIHPRRAEVEFMIKRVSDEIERNKSLLDEKTMEEFQRAQKYYEGLLPIAK